MDGNVATCLELEAAIKDAAIPKDSSECQSLQDAFSPTCSYSIPTNACDICPNNAVSVSASAEWNGKEMKCSDAYCEIDEIVFTVAPIEYSQRGAAPHEAWPYSRRTQSAKSSFQR